MARFRAKLAYDGGAYLGFQRQAHDTPTIQGALERALTAVTGQYVAVVGAGRTDAGVHASGQVIAFDVAWRHSDQALLRALNIALPDDIALLDIRQQPGFRPRFDARSRRYAYQVYQAPLRHPLLRGRVWLVRDPLNGPAMQAAAALLIGCHDFAAFGTPPRGENTVRTVFQSGWTRQAEYNGWLWTYRIEANAFLQHMVRRIVGLLVQVGRGRCSPEEFTATLRRAQLIAGSSMAPPQGLTLEAVRYDDE